MLAGGEEPLTSPAAWCAWRSRISAWPIPQALLLAHRRQGHLRLPGLARRANSRWRRRASISATAPKSNAVYKAFGAARRAAKETGSLMPPAHILNAPTKLMKRARLRQGLRLRPRRRGGFLRPELFPRRDGAADASTARPTVGWNARSAAASHTGPSSAPNGRPANEPRHHAPGHRGRGRDPSRPLVPPPLSGLVARRHREALPHWPNPRRWQARADIFAPGCRPGSARAAPRPQCD